MQILHLSDLHIGRDGARSTRNRRAEKLVRRIEGSWGRAEAKPLVLITGDVVDNGEEEEFLEARRTLRPLLDAGFTVLPIPGNHDYGWAGSYAQAKKFALFKRYLLGTTARVGYPQVAYDEEGVTLITLDSMKAETGFPDGLLANGEMGRAQRRSLARIIASLHEERPAEQRIVVALHHHPFLFPGETPLELAKDWVGHRLKDGESLMKVLQGRVHALLFGHEGKHLDFSRRIGGRVLTEESSIPCILCNGNSTDPRLPARVITMEAGRDPTWRKAPWR